MLAKKIEQSSKSIWIMVRYKCQRQKNPHKGPLGRSLVGLEGQATTDLRPSGFVSVNGKIYDAISEDDLIKRNSKIIVQMERGKLLDCKESRHLKE